MKCIVCHRPATTFYRSACGRCNVDRLCAALEYMHAAEAVRLLTMLGAQVVAGHHVPPNHRGRLEHAMSRLNYADDECVRLKLWPVTRATRRPPWFYGDERSNTA